MSDLLCIIKNGYLSRKFFVNVKFTKLNLTLLNFFLKKGLIKSYKIEKKTILVFLRYIKNKPLLRDLKLISKKGFRKYITVDKLKLLNNKSGTNIIILSTPYGFLTSAEALTLNTGGELLINLIF